MYKKKVFISFDYDHDNDLKMLLVGQSRNAYSPFEISDMSIKHEIKEDWKATASSRIKRCDVVIVLCGAYTNTASGVSAEVEIAQNGKIPYFLLKGRANSVCKKPLSAKSTDIIYDWTWDNIKRLLEGVY